MLNKENAKHFKEVMKHGLWRDRYYLVRENYFNTFNLIEDKECKWLLIEAAINDKASLVRQEAVKTCNALHIKTKGNDVKLGKMPPLNKIINMKDKNLNEIIFLSCVKAGIQMYPRNRTLTDKEKMDISKKFSELYPELFDIIDGRTTRNTKGNISKKKIKQFTL